MRLTASSLLLLLGCAPALRAVVPSAVQRHALAAPDPASRTVLGVELSFQDSAPQGGKPTLLCLHAIGHGGGDYAALAGALPDWRVIALDWPGHGRSGSDSQPVSAARYAALLRAFMEALGLERAVLLGNSIGGAAAIRVAAEDPGRVRALVLANPGGLDPGASSFIGRLFIGRLVSRFEQGVRNEARYGPWFRDYYADILVTPAAAAQRERIIAAAWEHAPLLVEAWTSFMQPEASLERVIPQVTQPVLFTWADADRLVSWSRNEDAVRRFPNARVVHFSQSGHAPFLEEPEAFLRVLRDELTSLNAVTPAPR
jgi:pimeloyl-ACP methyl ester carboxylesterase